MNNQPEQKIRGWGARDVALWLQEVGFGDCAQDFRSNRVDGNTLLSMTASQLRAYPCLSDANKRDGLKVAIARLPGSALGKVPQRSSHNETRRKHRSSRHEDSTSPPPPLPERPKPTANDEYMDGQEEDGDGYYDDSFDDTDYDDDDEGFDDDTGGGAPPQHDEKNDTIRMLQAKFHAFGLRDDNTPQQSALEQQYLDEYDDDDEGDVYDVPPEFQYSYPPQEEDYGGNEDDIYDVPPEEAQGHAPAYQPPPPEVKDTMPTTAQPISKAPMMRAPIKTDTHALPTSQSRNISATKPSSKVFEQRKMFENNTAAPKHDINSNLPSSNNKTVSGNFGKKFDSPSTIAVPEQPVKRPASPKLPVKPAFTKSDNVSPQLPPRNLAPVKGTQQPADYEEEVKLDHIPSHLRDRYERARQRKTSKSGEGDISPELRQLRAKEEEKQQKIDKKGFKPPPLPPVEASDQPETGGTSIKDRMKMFSASSTEEEPPKSPRWGGSFDRKQGGNPALSKPPVDYKAKTLPHSPKPQVKVNNAPALPSRHELPPPRMDDSSAPRLPDRNTKPSRFGAKQPAVSPSIGKRPPMPPPVSSVPIDEDNYDPPDIHQQLIEEDTYEPPMMHNNNDQEDFSEENYDPPPQIPGKFPAAPSPQVHQGSPSLPPREIRRPSEPDLPPRPSKGTKMPAPEPKVDSPGGRRNTYAPNSNKLLSNFNAPKPAPPPQTQAKPSNPLEQFPWYRGEIDRRATEAALDKEATDGCFIVRDPSKAEEKRLGFYSLSIWHAGKTRHLRIRCRSDKKYVVGESKEDEKPFDSVADLIKHHKKTPLLLKSGGSTPLTCIPRS
ncbi:serine/arginine repetitive matrix protein 1-like isoform X2 [Dysidea avara]|uniref:serine/arginine repetitive matrix protein 1-like isoform X2 n=1 Tax=Dysidea avara TaxID=196820 RepID=UPI0033240BE4